ncbi:hypothetical protein [Clavibacter sp. VKM Ac-2872]|uniref:hypothetical protein n=1 Tax=Clavibacter sp. VKM Ac-2872 TaxID=2783812 RepID=UPI00188D4FA3|nr:hypothetical protein [Clavibacter sp. VKM Ac-2872]MBF4622824.1 hypothetical protein [Clavibacter sp. VKM Ac-2872]
MKFSSKRDTNERNHLMKRKQIAIASFVSPTALAMTVATPAQAATATFFDGSAAPDVIYTEGTVHQSRTGITAGFTEETITGLANIQVWLGTATTNAWSYEATIYDTRNYRKGAFKWKSPGETASHNAKAAALDVGRIRSDVIEESTATEGRVENTVVPNSALLHVASASNLSKDDLVAIGQYEGVQLWRASNASDTFLFTSGGSEEDYVTSARASNSSFSQRAISVRNSIPEADGAVETHQFILTDDAHEADIASVDGLRNIGHDLFVDTRVGERAEDQITTFGAAGTRPTSESDEAREPASYALALSGGQ